MDRGAGKRRGGERQGGRLEGGDGGEGGKNVG